MILGILLIPSYLAPSLQFTHASVCKSTILMVNHRRCKMNLVNDIKTCETKVAN